MVSPFSDDSFPCSESPPDEAVAWFIRLRRPIVGTADRDAFTDWLSANPLHAEAYDKVERLWQSQSLSSALALVDLQLPTASSSPQRRRMSLPRWAMAASMLLFTGWGLLASGLLDRWRADYVTVAGQQSHVMLADGSAVTLNTDSALALDFTRNRRGVRLLRGEAYFEVQPDSARPFTVTTDSAQVRVVGTRFTVRAGESTAVGVESGIVTCANDRSQPINLSVGQHTNVSRQHISPPTPVDANRDFAWLSQRLVFQDQPLSQVIAELDRYHPGSIVITKAALTQTHVSGNYKLDDTAAIIQSLANIAGAQVIAITPYLTFIR